jgi:hypothetical protein
MYAELLAGRVDGRLQVQYSGTVAYQLSVVSV